MALEAGMPKDQIGAFDALLYLDGELDHTMSVAIDGDKIAAIYIVRNPDKLRHPPAAAAH
jgi:RNA polymerase sigma-70 factor (ECF subfamily)